MPCSIIAYVHFGITIKRLTLLHTRLFHNFNRTVSSGLGVYLLQFSVVYVPKFIDFTFYTCFILCVVQNNEFSF